MRIQTLDRKQFQVRLACIFTLFVSTGLCVGSDLEATKTLLGKPIIEKETSQQEVIRFIESRIVPFPEVTSAAEWEKYADQLREETLAKVVFRGEAANWRDYKGQVEWLETLPGGPEYNIRKLKYEALPGLWIPALLYEPKELKGKVPVVMNVNGHDGDGKLAKYKQIRCINQAKRGMIALNVEWLGMGQLQTVKYRHTRMNQIDLCGTSGLAPFYLSMKRGLDVLLSHENADPQRVAVAGLSGGGWQTILISSLDRRVTLANPVAGYSSFRTRVKHHSDLGDSEQTPVDLAMIADYDHLTAMRAPRPTLLTYNAEDNCCFKADHALPPLLDVAQPIYKLYDKSSALRWHINEVPGSHNFEIDNRQQFYQMLGDFFYANSDNFDAKEIPCDDELKSKEDLHIPLPEDNENFNSLALGLMKSLPVSPHIPLNKTGLTSWQKNQRELLRSVVHAQQESVQATQTGTTQTGSTTATFWKLVVDGNWTVPAVQLKRGDATPKSTVVVLADAGRAAVASQVDALLNAGKQVVAIDPFYMGESQVAGRHYLFALFVSSVGERTTGIQATQVSAIAKWLKESNPSQQIEVHSIGPRCGLFSLVAAAMNESNIDQLTLEDALATFKQIIESNESAHKNPDYFCFGLLHDFDTPQLSAMVAPRKLIYVKPTQRHQNELRALQHVYKSFGVDFDPVKAK